MERKSSRSKNDGVVCLIRDAHSAWCDREVGGGAHDRLRGSRKRRYLPDPALTSNIGFA